MSICVTYFQKSLQEVTGQRPDTSSMRSEVYVATRVTSPSRLISGATATTCVMPSNGWISRLHRTIGPALSSLKSQQTERMTWYEHMNISFDVEN